MTEWLCYSFPKIFPAFVDIFMTLNSYKPTRLEVNIFRQNRTERKPLGWRSWLWWRYFCHKEIKSKN